MYTVSSIQVYTLYHLPCVQPVSPYLMYPTLSPPHPPPPYLRHPIPTRTVHRPADAASTIFTTDYDVDTDSHPFPIRTTTVWNPSPEPNRRTTCACYHSLHRLRAFLLHTDYHHNPPDAAHFLPPSSLPTPATPAPPRRTHDRRRRSRCQDVERGV